MKYEIEGGNLPVVVCHLEQGEALICDSGAMSWMDPVMQMSTGAGGFGKAMSHMFTKETMFRNTYTASAPGMIAFASSFPGSIRAVEVNPGQDIIVQKSSFLASTTGIETSVAFTKKFSGGLFGGEGFIMTRMAGQGLVFIEIDGSALEYELAPGQQIVIDSGYLAMMDATCTMEVQTVKGMKNKLLGGEGLFNTVVTGPGKVIVQSMPVSQFAGSIAPYIATGK
ncbi:MAG: TIGR00266 family protein [Thomasclavelia sp.]|jgi:uncharacterized protein (TIGR00266 family)|nr:TIGR00266 family protein [Thomasclavelia sp.]